jgi:hypothetical protein
MLHGFTDLFRMVDAVNQKRTFGYCFRIEFRNDFLIQQEIGLHSPKH